jgi:RNA 3'-terminal phosphate cyclase
MSWSVKLRGTPRNVRHELKAQSHLPPTVDVAAAAMLTAFGDEEELELETAGHIHEGRGNVSITLNTPPKDPPKEP